MCPFKRGQVENTISHPDTHFSHMSHTPLFAIYQNLIRFFQRDAYFPHSDLDYELRTRNPLLGIPDAFELHDLAEANGLRVLKTTRMPEGTEFLAYRRLVPGETLPPRTETDRRDAFPEPESFRPGQLRSKTPNSPFSPYVATPFLPYVHK